MENEKVIMEKKLEASAPLALSYDGDYDHDHEEEEDEEEKMDKFFELISSFREARNRLREGIMVSSVCTSTTTAITNITEEKKKKTTKRKRHEEDVNKSWVPSFEMEDFTAQVEYRGIDPTIFPFPAIKCTNDKEDRKRQQLLRGLNLNLTL
ncbi:NIM1-interacting protein [Parasponia andersonii]|uniref:NIM1-interacting protein n=1 Tax=Parasponia andersonii TaxID=3476 RepID=A0A2P5CL80_PARAD|nr:NIM1-interacting protein [Parasponia andersonii]